MALQNQCYYKEVSLYHSFHVTIVVLFNSLTHSQNLISSTAAFPTKHRADPMRCFDAMCSRQCCALIMSRIWRQPGSVASWRHRCRRKWKRYFVVNPVFCVWRKCNNEITAITLSACWLWATKFIVQFWISDWKFTAITEATIQRLIILVRFPFKLLPVSLSNHFYSRLMSRCWVVNITHLPLLECLWKTDYILYIIKWIKYCVSLSQKWCDF